MTTPSAVHRDERTMAVENASYRWAFHVFSYGLLVLVMYRGLVRNEAAWDLMALVIIGGTVASLYQWAHDVLTKRTARMVAVTMAVAAAVAAAIAALAASMR